MLSEPSAVRRPRSPTLFLCGGGTGGHVYPALAVAEALTQGSGVRGQESEAETSESADVALIPEGSGVRGQGSEAETSESADVALIPNPRSPIPRLVYVGSEEGMEAGLVSRESDLPFQAIPAAGLRGRAPWTLARNTGILARGTRAARRLIAEERPAAILGTGGYVCVPLFLAAWAAGVPTAIYLPDVVPGMAVRVLARLATRVACNVEDSIPYFRLRADRSKIVVTGYPTRQELYHQDRAACRAAFGLEDTPPVLFVYGGSRGARSINKAIAALLEHLLPIAQVIHVCGREGDEGFLREAAARLPEHLRARYRLYPYLHSRDPDTVTRRQGDKVTGGEGDKVTRGQGDKETLERDPVSLSPSLPVSLSMVRAFGAADLAVCRSGASTLGELPAAGLPAVLVPYPYVHQEENADYLAHHGAALKIHDGQMLGGGRPEDGPLFRHIRHLIDHAEERAEMSERSRALARPDAARRLGELLIALATSKRPQR